MKYIQNFQIDTGMKFLNHLRRQPADALIRYSHIVNRPVLNNVLAIRNKLRQNYPMYD